MLLHGRKVLVVGLGISGRSAANFLLQRCARVDGVDHNLEILSSPEVTELCEMGLQTFYQRSQNQIQSYDFVVISPGVPASHPDCLAARKTGIEVIGEAELACRMIHQKMIGITGTNGKTTVTLMVEHILNLNGIPARAMGNSGVPLTAEVDEQDPFLIVAELSSFQLETMQSKVLDAGAILNITPDHLDRYASFEEYAKAKFQIADCMKVNAPLYVSESICLNFPNFSPKIPCRSYGCSANSYYYADNNYLKAQEKIETLLPRGYRGCINHHLENFLAAFAICRELGVPSEGICEAAESFQRPPHRIEFIRELHGVSYYDDSKGTNIDAVSRAVESIPGPILLIAGGVDKGAPYTPWIKDFKGKVLKIFAIGQAAKTIKKQLNSEISVEICRSMEEAVFQASYFAKSGESVLLSPGCSSFDMFKNYAHRGQVYKKIVQALK